MNIYDRRKLDRLVEHLEAAARQHLADAGQRGTDRYKEKMYLFRDAQAQAAELRFIHR